MNRPVIWRPGGQTAPHRKKVLVFFWYNHLFESCQLSQFFLLKLHFVCVCIPSWLVQVAGNQLNEPIECNFLWFVFCVRCFCRLSVLDLTDVVVFIWSSDGDSGGVCHCAMRRRYVSAGCRIKSWPVIIIENRIRKKGTHGVIRCGGTRRGGKSGENP